LTLTRLFLHHQKNNVKGDGQECASYIIKS